MKNDAGVLTLKNTKFFTIFKKNLRHLNICHITDIYISSMSQENITLHEGIIDYRRQPPISLF